MQILTAKGGWGRNRRFGIESGHIRLQRKGSDQQITLSVKDGRITEIVESLCGPYNRWAGTVTTRVWDGAAGSPASGIKTVNTYDSRSNLPYEGVFYEVSGLRIGRHRGTLRQLSRNARFVREEFVYDNGQEAYVWTPYRRRFRLYRPNRKLWLEVTARVKSHYRRTRNLLERVQSTLGDISGNGNTWTTCPEYEIKLYDGLLRLCGYGKVENRQRAGVWRQGRTRHHFLMGVAVSEEIYRAGPDDLDPREVLRTDNVQLRAALMQKIGPQRLIEKLPFTACDTDGDNRLLKVDVNAIFAQTDETQKQPAQRGRRDSQIAIVMLKCPSTAQLYYLRVPPGLRKVEHARQWLCGIDIESVEEEYIRDKWAGIAGGLRFSASQESMMQAEIRRAGQRQRLEFISEA